MMKWVPWSPLSSSKFQAKIIMPLVGDEPLGLKAGFKKAKIFRAFSPNRAKKSYCEEGSSDGKSSVRSSDTFDSDSFDGTDETDSEVMDNTDFTIKKSLSYENLAYANHVGGSSIGDRIYYQSYNSNEDKLSVSTVDRKEREMPKRSIFTWRKRKLGLRSFKAKGEPLLKRDVREEGGDDIDFDRRLLTSSDESTYGVSYINVCRYLLMNLLIRVIFYQCWVESFSNCISSCLNPRCLNPKIFIYGLKVFLSNPDARRQPVFTLTKEYLLSCCDPYEKDPF